MKTARSNSIKFYLLLCVIAAGSCLSANAQVAAGGTYTLNQTVIANGGGTSTGPGYQVDGTAGQSAAGANATGAPYAVKNGFWAAAQAAPTAAHVAISGRVLDPNGMGIRNVVVTLAGDALTSPRTVLTSSFGYFTFSDIESGESYVLSVKSKRYGFGQPAQVFSVMDNVTGLVFQATWQN